MKEKFIEIVKEALEIEDQELSLNDKLSDFDAWDSMARLSLIALLDEHFETQVDDSEFDDINTVEDLFELVKSRAN